MEQLKRDYKDAIRQLERLKQSLTGEQKKVEGQIIGGMISDLRYALEWLNTGRRPGNRRGIERLAAYQREKPFDPILMQKYFDSTYANTFSLLGNVSVDVWEARDIEKCDSISFSDKERIEDALSVLTEREKEIYIMARGRCLTHCEIAEYLKIKRSTVGKVIERADKKIAKRTSESLLSLVG